MMGNRKARGIKGSKKEGVGGRWAGRERRDHDQEVVAVSRWFWICAEESLYASVVRGFRENGTMVVVGDLQT